MSCSLDSLGAADLQQFQHASGHDPDGLLRGGVLGAEVIPLREQDDGERQLPARQAVYRMTASQRGYIDVDDARSL